MVYDPTLNCGMMGGFGYGNGGGLFFMLLTAIVLIGLASLIFVWIAKILK